MNRSIVIHMLGWAMNMETIFMTLPVITAVIYRRNIGFIYLGVAVICGLLGFLCTGKKPCTKMSFVREGFVTVSLGWIVLSLFGCMPLVINGEIPHIIDAMFEIVSDFAITGSSTILKVEDMSHATLVWRGLSHWVGGMGILVFVLVTLSMAGDYNVHIMKAESPGPFMEKLVPRIRITAKLSYSIYFYMTIVMMILLLLGKIPLFDSICTNFGTVGIGGFACHNPGQADYTMYQQAIITIFMLLSSVNFNVYYLLLVRRPKDAGRREGLREHLATVAIATLLATINIRDLFPSLSVTFHQTTFQVFSIITTTGCSIVDYNSWPEFSETILLLIISIGTCAGSTGGGTKVPRVMTAFKEIKKGMASAIRPRSAKMLKFKGKSLEHNILRSLNTYIIVHFIIFSISILITSLDNYDFMIPFSAVVTNLNNIGPGMSAVGPSSNYFMVSYLSKTVLILDIPTGRLELFPMLVLLSLGTRKRS